MRARAKTIIKNSKKYKRINDKNRPSHPKGKQQKSEKRSKNKKVLLREHKRHTARRVSSARYAGREGYLVPGPGRGVPGPRSGEGGYLVPGLGGYPDPGRGGVPSPRSGGVPHPRSGDYPIPGLGRYPIPGLGGTPSRPGQGGGEGVPHPDLVRGWGVPQVPPPPCQTWDGVSPQSDLGWGTPRPDLGWGTPHRNGEQTDIPKYKYYLPSYYVRGR